LGDWKPKEGPMLILETLGTGGGLIVLSIVSSFLGFSSTFGSGSRSNKVVERDK